MIAVGLQFGADRLAAEKAIHPESPCRPNISGTITGDSVMRQQGRDNIAASLRGKCNEESRGWKGDSAGYVAKHIWLKKHFGKATHCSLNPNHKAKRYEWHNISKTYKRDISDWMQLCPSCHRKIDKGSFCKRGHEYTEENTYICKHGWRHCRTCRRKAIIKWKNAQ
jgi:hypothetical protein